jgi:hypothetical protein
VGIPIGLVGVVLLLYILRQYLKYKNSCTTTVYFPPDPIDPFATRIIPKIELDAVPNAIYELDGTTAPNEIADSKSAVTDLKKPASIVSELEGSPVIPPDPTNRASAATTLNEDRWSDVSSLAPPVVHRASRARPSIAETLSIVSQQHHGSGQDVFLTPPRPHASHRLSRPASGFLPNIGVSHDEIPLTPKTNIAAVSKHGSDDVQESPDAKQFPNNHTAQTSSEAAQKVGTAQAGESAQEIDAADEGEVSRKSDAEVQTDELEQAVEIISEVKAAHKSEDSHRNDMKLQAGEDMHENEIQHEDTAPHEADTQAKSSK